MRAKSFEEFLNEKNNIETTDLDRYFGEMDENFDPMSFTHGIIVGNQIGSSGGGGEVSMGVGLAIIGGSLLASGGAIALAMYWDNIKSWWKGIWAKRRQRKMDKMFSGEVLANIANVLKESYPDTWKMITSNKYRHDIAKELDKSGVDHGIEAKYILDLIAKLKEYHRKNK